MESSGEGRSVCIGIWVKVGSRYESPEINGVSHFLEHMFFKGTVSRSAQDIAMAIDSMGGELNALTSNEYTLYYVKVLDEFIEQALDLLTDIFLNSTFPSDELDKEKNIISEEIKMVEDTPSDYVHDVFSKNVWGEKGLGQTILGKSETIETFKRETLLSHIQRFYGADNVLVACSGRFDEDRLINRLNAGIGSLDRDFIPVTNDRPVFTPGCNVLSKDLSEAHVCLGLEGIPYSSDERYTMHLLNTVLGSGFSSRLFQEIREKRGLVYSIYSFHLSSFDAGIWSVYAGTDRKNLNEVIEVSSGEIKNLSKTLTPDEVKRAKSQLKGNLILALESTSNKMTNIAKQEIYYGKYFTPEEVIANIESVTIDDMKELSERLVDRNRFALTVYGPVTGGEITSFVC